jgi:hypothetical protein
VSLQGVPVHFPPEAARRKSDANSFLADDLPELASDAISVGPRASGREARTGCVNTAVAETQSTAFLEIVS